MCLDDDGVARPAPQPLDSYWYPYVQKLQKEKQKIIIIKKTEKTRWRLAQSWGESLLTPACERASGARQGFCPRLLAEGLSCSSTPAPGLGC